MNHSLEAERARAQLPKLRSLVGQSTVDVFGHNQAYALFNDLHYRPRPVFQSYAAYNATLMDLNDRALTTKAAPEFMLLNLDPIDGRFPALEDARVLRRLLADYTLVSAEAPFLLLRHQQTSAIPMTLLREGVLHADEPLAMAEFGDADLWLEISLAPSLKGRLRQAFYKPPEVYLAVWGQNPLQVRLFRAPVPMLAAGFLASPVVVRTQDLLDVYTGKAIRRPGGYAIRFQPGTAGMWQERIQYRVYRIDAKLGRNSTPDLTAVTSPNP